MVWLAPYDFIVVIDCFLSLRHIFATVCPIVSNCGLIWVLYEHLIIYFFSLLILLLTQVYIGQCQHRCVAFWFQIDAFFQVTFSLIELFELDIDDCSVVVQRWYLGTQFDCLSIVSLSFFKLFQVVQQCCSIDQGRYIMGIQLDGY